MNQLKSESVQWKLQTPVATFFLVAGQRGLQGIYWKEKKVPYAQSLRGKDPATAFLARTEHQLREYLAGKRRVFDIPLDLQGTPFQKKVWAQLLQIPYGKVRSYKEIAERIQNPRAVRAVGTANGRNPVSIFVPCHRVIASDGTLGGYAGGLPLKAWLLELEKSGR